MKVLVLGKGVANDGVIMLLQKEEIAYDYLNQDEVCFFDYEYVVKAPGIPYYDPIIKKLIQKNIRIITDIELAMMLSSHYFIGVTGSNGKTTTVTLITQMLSARYQVIACGNIGYSVCRAVVEHPTADILVVELSSFQLERSTINPHISVLLNVHPCHQNHHESYRDYLDSKSRITLNQSENHVVVYNYSDKLIKRFIQNTAAKKISFSTDSCLTHCYTDREYIYFNGKKIVKLSSDLKAKEFLLADVMASIGVALQVRGVKPKHIKKAMQQFKEVAFRMTKLNDFIYNDAKSTNPYSTIAAIQCLDNIFLICGGYDRKENLSCLNEHLHKLKKVYAYGQTKDKIYNYMSNHNVECVCFRNLEEAFIQALQERNNENILFSPMYASFDSFKNYIERGNFFNQLFSKYFNS